MKTAKKSKSGGRGQVERKDEGHAALLEQMKLWDLDPSSLVVTMEPKELCDMLIGKDGDWFKCFPSKEAVALAARIPHGFNIQEFTESLLAGAGRSKDLSREISAVAIFFRANGQVEVEFSSATPSTRRKTPST
jgi:hypothetical protein